MRGSSALRLALLATTLLTSGCCKPPLNSVRAAYGDSHHIAVVNAFLDGTADLPNHVPATWPAERIHAGFPEASADTTQYYEDSLVPCSGDADPTHGVDRTMLFFQASHGGPDWWNAWNAHQAHPSNVLIGDGMGHGCLRYWWQCTCKAFAHGPSSDPATPTAPVYASPHLATGATDSASMRNVFVRWGPALGRDLRVACGASTDVYCYPESTNSLWFHKTVLGYDVSDSLMEGFTAVGIAVPLCIATGGDDWTDNALFDVDFTNDANEFAREYYYIQFRLPSSVTIEARVPTSGPGLAPPPSPLPILPVGPLEITSPIRDLAFHPEGTGRKAINPHALEAALGTASPPGLAASRVNALRLDGKSGAIYIRGTTSKPSTIDLGDPAYAAASASAIQALGLSEHLIAETEIARNMLARRRISEQGAEPTSATKNIVVTKRRGIPVPGIGLIPVLGDGGIIKIQLNPDGSLINAAKVWRRIKLEELPFPHLAVKSFDAALAEAKSRVPNQGDYELADYRWGYKEFEGNREQTELRIHYEFFFRNRNPANDSSQRPPQWVEILAQPGGP